MSAANEDIIDYIYRSTEGEPERWNEAFRLNFMAFNPHGPGLVSRFKMMDNLITLAEQESEEEGWNDPEDAKFLRFCRGIPLKSKQVLFAAGSIDARMLEIVLTKKQLARVWQSKLDDPHRMFNNSSSMGGGQ